MAHLASYKMGDAKRIFAESDRSMSDLVYVIDGNGNKKYVVEQERKDKQGKRYKNYVDLSRSHLNYNFVPVDGLTTQERLEKRVSEVDYKGKIPFETVNVMGSWIFTKPKDFDGDVDLLFREFYNFNCQRYGAENIIDAHVHKDETTEHTGCRVVPVIKYTDKKTGEEREKLSAKQVFTKQDLRTYHQDLSRHMEMVFGYDVGVLLEDDDPNKNGDLSLDEYKFKEQRKKQGENVDKDRELFIKNADLNMERNDFEDEKKVFEADKTAFEAEKQAEWDKISEERKNIENATQEGIRKGVEKQKKELEAAEKRASKAMLLAKAEKDMYTQAISVVRQAEEKHLNAIKELPKGFAKKAFGNYKEIKSNMRTGVKDIVPSKGQDDEVEFQ
jgi:hypothetical protein